MSRPSVSARPSLGIRVGAVTLAATVAVTAGVAATAQTAQLDTNLTVSGQGATFSANFIEQCKADVKNSFNINVGYSPTGSGAGRAGFIAGNVDWASSDVPFTAAELQSLRNKPFRYIPITTGGIAVIYRLTGVSDIRLSGPTLGKIFSGQAPRWNDEAIVKDNPGVSLPDTPIKVVVRSDSSGTSNVFSDYLSVASKGVWKAGVQNTFPVPSGNGIAQRGSDGVTNYVQGGQGEGAITYSEVSFANERKLPVAKVINTSGNAVTPEAANVTAAIGAAAINDDGTLLLNFNAPAANAYPISTTSYAIVAETMDKAKGDVLRTYLTYALTGCQGRVGTLGYAPLPKNLVDLGLQNVARINPGSAPVPTVPGAAPATTAAAPTTAAPVTTAAATTAAPTTKAATPTTKKKTAKKVTPTTKKK